MTDFPFGSSPVDLPGADDAPQSVMWAAKIVGISALLLALLNPATVRDWSHDLPAGPFSQPIMAAADVWYQMLDGAGVTQGWKWVHAVWVGLLG